jgi:2-amino-4-hydroxy-6-hydroxymethyldihydropteridine diphosphokinase
VATVALGLGSNLGNRLVNLRVALKRLKEANPGAFKIVGTSDVFETAPWGVEDQPHFLNACLLTDCTLAPPELLALLKNVEEKMGRTTTRRWGERVIDIDILLMDEQVYDSPVLHIPHVDTDKRDFVLIPLAQILPYWIHPVTQRTLSEMAEKFRDRELIRICAL